MERDQFQCQFCYNKKNTLVVHHKWYLKGLKPWEYDDDCYITLCETCHNVIHKSIEMFPLENIITKLMTKTDYVLFANRFQQSFEKNGKRAFEQIDKMLLSMVVNLEDM